MLHFWWILPSNFKSYTSIFKDKFRKFWPYPSINLYVNIKKSTFWIYSPLGCFKNNTLRNKSFTPRASGGHLLEKNTLSKFLDMETLPHFVKFKAQIYLNIKWIVLALHAWLRYWLWHNQLLPQSVVEWFSVGSLQLQSFNSLWTPMRFLDRAPCSSSFTGCAPAPRGPWSA